MTARIGFETQAVAPDRGAASARRSVLLWTTAAVVVVGVVLVRLYRINSIQTDVYGDIALVYDYVSRIRRLEWPFGFFPSAGPLYHYLVAPLTAVFGATYLTFKLASIVTSLGVLAATWALARRLEGDRFALVALTVCGMSSWLLVFSRLGNSQIILPLLSMGSLWLTVRFVESGRRSELIACAVVCSLGLYGYPQTFVLPLVVWLTLVALKASGHRIKATDLLVFILVAAACAIPFARIASRDVVGWAHGYIGTKLETERSASSAFWTNVVSAALAFHVKGDEVFRSNPVRAPHLDVVSGVLFVIGGACWLLPPRRRWAPLLWVPFILLQLPSVLVLARPREVPSASRTLAVAPIAYLFVATGVWSIWEAGVRMRRRRSALVIAALAVMMVIGLNLRRYFRDYVNGLPYHDVSISGEIAAYIDGLPADTSVYLIGCCWEGDMPAAPFVQLMASTFHPLYTLESHRLACGAFDPSPSSAVVVWTFREPLPPPGLERCLAGDSVRLHRSANGYPVFHSAAVKPDRTSAPAPPHMPR